MVEIVVERVPLEQTAKQSIDTELSNLPGGLGEALDCWKADCGDGSGTKLGNCLP